MYLILRSKYFNKYFYFSQIGIYILILHLSAWNLDYMIPKGISHTSVQNPTYEFQKRYISSIQELLVPFRTTKDCHSCRSLLLVWQICSLNWDLDMDSFVGTLCTSFDGPVAKYLLVMQGAWVQIQIVMFITFSWWHPWSLGSNLVFIFLLGLRSFWQTIMNDFGNI